LAEAPHRWRRWQGITLATLFVGYGGYYVCRTNLSVATPLMLEELAGQGLTKTDLGAVASAGVLLYAVGKLANGVLTDFASARLLFVAGMAASVACTVLFGLAAGLAMFMAVWAGNRYVQSMGWGALVKMAARWFPPRRHASVMGALSLSYLLGDALTRLYLGWFISEGVGWRGVFFVSAASLGAIAVLCWCLLRDSPRDVGGGEPAPSPDNLFGGDGTRPPGLRALFRPFAGSLTFWVVCLINLGLTLIRETFNFWTPTYLREVAGLDAGAAAQASLVFPLVGAAAVLLAGRVSDRLHGKHGRVMVPCLVLLVGALWLLAAADTRGKPVLALLLIAGVSCSLLPPYSFCAGVMALDLGGKRGPATAAGLIDTAGYLGAVLSGYGIGRVAEAHGWAAAFGLLAAVAGLTLATAALYWVRQELHRQRPAIALHRPKGPSMTAQEALPPGPTAIDRLLQLYRERGSAAYLGERVSQTEHALQTAWAAEKAGADPALISAALLHDVGHLLQELPEKCAAAGIDDAHEARGARWLAAWFGPEVVEPISLHVPAKRFLCATEPTYTERLSDASRVSLRLQGGPFTEQEAAEFCRHRQAQAAVALRRWDEAAKVAGLTTPPLEHFRTYLEVALVHRSH
jgi:OPA family glycerol-3-phosphate transporter-like MFS transporter